MIKDKKIFAPAFADAPDTLGMKLDFLSRAVMKN